METWLLCPGTHLYNHLHFPETIWHILKILWHLPQIIRHLPKTTWHLPVTIYHLLETNWHLPKTIFAGPSDFLPRPIYTLPWPHDNFLRLSDTFSCYTFPRRSDNFWRLFDNFPIQADTLLRPSDTIPGSYHTFWDHVIPFKDHLSLFRNHLTPKRDCQTPTRDQLTLVLVLVLLLVYTSISTGISHDFGNTVFGGPGRPLKDVQGLFYIFWVNLPIQAGPAVMYCCRGSRRGGC